MEKTELKIPIKQLEVVKCPACKRENFNQVYRLRKLPSIYSPTGQAGLIVENVYQCDHCLSLYTKDELLNEKTN